MRVGYVKCMLKVMISLGAAVLLNGCFPVYERDYLIEGTIINELEEPIDDCRVAIYIKSESREFDYWIVKSNFRIELNQVAFPKRRFLISVNCGLDYDVNNYWADAEEYFHHGNAKYKFQHNSYILPKRYPSGTFVMRFADIDEEQERVESLKSLYEYQPELELGKRSPEKPLSRVCQ